MYNTRSVSNNLKSMPPWSVSFDIDHRPGLGPCIEVDLIQNPVDPISKPPSNSELNSETFLFF
jgi:hypothetical protein